MTGSVSSRKHLGDAVGAAVLLALLACGSSIRLRGGCHDSAQTKENKEGEKKAPNAYLVGRRYLGDLGEGIE